MLFGINIAFIKNDNNNYYLIKLVKWNNMVCSILQIRLKQIQAFNIIFKCNFTKIKI